MNIIFLISIFCLAEGYLNNGLLSISITRHHKGDIFIAQGEKCYKDFCVSLSGGTAVPTGNNECECKCTSNRPVFRDDLNTCVDDIQECSLVPFANNSGNKKVPYVFLPLKGQIVYPSADIIVSDVENPVCVVSGGQFLGQNGWSNLKNNSGTETPFRLFRDEGKNYLQWIGESPLRMAMEGRIILVHLMCKDASVTEEPKIYTPCIAFRVAGNPSVKEMMFITDVRLKEEYGGNLSVREYITIGVCSLFLAIIYVASVFLYLYVKRKRNKKSKKTGEGAQLTLGEEGVIKSNPLLQATKYLSAGGQDNAGYISESNSCCSDVDQTSDLLCLDDEELMGSQNMQTSAIIHPCDFECAESAINQDSNNIEKLPEENVSIVETLEIKDDHPETIKAMACASGRRKLYFNPSYFEPDLLKAPPPAAMEFLVKIREVIAIAKHKMSAKKFSPSLLGIPEEDGSSKTDYNSILATQKDQLIAEKCETRKSPRLNKAPRENYCFAPKESCWPSDTKQKIIRKWLEDVPMMVMETEEHKSQKIISQENKTINKSKLWQINGENEKVPIPPARQERRKVKGKAPPVPPLKVEPNQESEIEKRESFRNTAAVNTKPQKCLKTSAPPRPPPMPSLVNSTDEVPRIQGKDCVPVAIAKNLMDAVIQELASYKKINKTSKLQEFPGTLNDVLNDNDNNLNQNCIEKHSEIVEMSHEENDNKRTEINKKAEGAPQDDHEYEIILLNGDFPSSDGKDIKIYNLPEILSKSDKTEGYSLVSEVYVNDGYSCCSGESPPSSYSNISVESDKVHYDIPNEKPGRLTIHVSDSPERYKTSTSESDNFEPDTLDRKPRKSKQVKRINEEAERYSNQKFQGMECYIDQNKSENFTDSLERPTILLKTNGTFKRNSLDKDIDNLFKNFSWSKVENVGSLREIYEAKSKNHRRRMETTSLIAGDNFHDRIEHDRFSTLSWNEERRNKLLHRGIILHINEGDSRKHKRTARCESHVMSQPKIPSRPPKPTFKDKSGSTSPITKSSCIPSSSLISIPKSMSPPLPPPRSAPSSPQPRPGTITPSGFTCLPLPQIQPRSISTSPVPRESSKGCASPSSAIQKSFKNSNINTSLPFSSPIPFKPPSPLPSISPPPRPPKTINTSPLLPPKSTKPPLPPKNSKKYLKSGKFSGRPLPPLPRSTPTKCYSSSSSLSYRDPETLSTFSGASMDSLNSSEYEAFYTLPYEEEGVEGEDSSIKEDFKTSKHATSNAISIVHSSSSTLNTDKRTVNRRPRDAERAFRGTNRPVVLRPEDSGYLSTDSESCCTQLMIPSHFSKIPEGGSQNSETEESFGDGASESGGESIATDSFFYGNFNKNSGRISEKDAVTEMYPFSLRLSDVEVNSDTERHCVPIMVRP